MAYQTGTLAGSYEHIDGTPHEGSVEIRPDNIHGNTIRDAAGKTVLAGPFTGKDAIPLVAGAFSVDLPASNDSTLDPAGATYTAYVRLNASGAGQKVVKGIYITAGQTVDMSSLVSVSPADASYQERVNEATASATNAAGSATNAAGSATAAAGSATTASSAATAAAGSATAAGSSATAAAGSATAAAGSATTAAATLASKAALEKVAAVVTVDGAAVVNKHNPVDATSAARTITLPTGQAEGSQISVEKTDATVNAVNVTGNVRSLAAQTLVLYWQNEAVVFRADSAGSWWPFAGHKTKSSLDTAYLPTAGGVEGVPALVYGDSFAASDFSSTGPTTRFPQRVNRRVGFGSLTNRAYPGNWMQDTASRANGVAQTLAANSTGVILLHSILNDVVNPNPTLAKRLNGFQHALRAFLLLARASSRVESSDVSFVTSGTWTTNNIGDCSGGSVRQTQSHGSCTITTPVCTDFSIGLFAVDPAGGAGGGATGTCTISVDGGAAVTVDLSNACGTTGSGDAARVWTPVQVPYFGLANTAHTVVVTDTSTGGLSTYLDNLLVLRKASKSPQVVIVKAEYCTAVGYTAYSASPTPTNATVDTYNALVDTVLASLDAVDNLTVLDPNVGGWTAATMTGVQTNSFNAIHPNDKGMAFLGDLIAKPLAALSYRSGMNV